MEQHAGATMVIAAYPRHRSGNVDSQQSREELGRDSELWRLGKCRHVIGGRYNLIVTKLSYVE